MPARKKSIINSNFCSQEDNEKLKEEYQQQIDVENLLKFLLKQELINAGDKRKVDSKTLIASIKEKGFSKLKTNEEELQQWLLSSGYVDVIGFHNVTFNQEKIKNLQDTRFANIVENEMEQLLMVLIADGIISENHLFLHKEELRRYLHKNRKRFPHVTQSDLGHNMLARAFVETKTTGDFELSKKKLKAMIQRREAAIESKNVAEVSVRAQLDQAIGLAVTLDLLSQSNLVVVRRKMRESLETYGLITPTEFYDVGYNLKKFGYLEQKPNNMAICFVFQLDKIKHLLDKRTTHIPKNEQSPEMLCPSKHEQVKQLVRQLVENEVLNQEQYVLRKDQVRLFLRENESEFPSLTFKNLGTDLRCFGFLLPEDGTGQTYNFVPSTIDAMIRMKKNDFAGSQTSLVSQESQSAFDTSSLRDQLQHLLGHLVRGGHLARNKNFVEKSVVVNILHNNIGLFSTLKETNIDQNLKKGGYLEYQLSPNIYIFRMQKILPIIEINENRPINLDAKPKTPVKSMMKKAKSLAELNANQTKQYQIERYFEYMVRAGLLTVEHNVVDRSVINYALHSEASEAWSVLKTANIGHQLMTCGYLDFQITPGTYNFRKEKIAIVLDKIATEVIEFPSEKYKSNTYFKQPTITSNLTEKEQVDLLVKQLVKAKVLTMFNTIIKKSSVHEVFRKNKQLFPSLQIADDDQECLDHKLREYGYLDHQITEGTFNFHKNRIESLLGDTSESSSDAESDVNVDDPQKNVEKIKELNQLVHMLIDQEYLSETKRIASKDVVRSVFLTNLENWRYAEFKELGYNLFTGGFIESASVNLGSFLFTECKMQEIFEERRRHKDPSNLTTNVPDPKTEFPQLAKASAKIPDFSKPPPQKSAPVIPQSNVLPTPNPNFLASQNYMQTVVNPLAAQQTMYPQFMLQQQFQQMQLQQSQFQQQKLIQQTQMQHNMRFPNFFQQNQLNPNRILHHQSLQNLTAPPCMVPQYFTPDYAALSQPEYGGLALDDFSSWKISRIITFARPKGEPLGIKSCYVCRKNFRMQIQFQEHMDTVHGPDFEIPLDVTMGKVVPVVFDLQLVQKGGRANYLTFKLYTKSGKMVTLNKIFYIYCSQYYPLAFKPSAAMVPTYEFEISREFFVTDDEQHSIVVFFEDIREYIEHFVVMTPKPLVNIENPIVMSDLQRPMLNHQVFNQISAKDFKPMAAVINVFNRHFLATASFSQQEKEICETIRNFMAADTHDRLNLENYVEMLSYAVQIADCCQEQAMIAYESKNHWLSLNGQGYYVVKLNGLSDKVAEGDYIQMRKSNQLVGSDYVLAVIMQLEANQIVVDIVDEGRIDVAGDYNLRFKKNRLSLKMEYQALENVNTHRLSQLMFPDNLEVATRELQVTEFEWFNQLIPTNPEQEQAVTHIVNGSATQPPYIIFGPPGTGKTSTIVEAICQLGKTAPTSRLLVTAQSNAACNEIVERLLKYLLPTDVYRMFAQSWKKKTENMSQELLNVASGDNGGQQFSGWKDINSFKVIVCTLVTAGRMVQAGVKTDHFTHVFIDECDSVTEPSALIPIAGLVSSMEQINAFVILAGDIQQLGPVYTTKLPDKMGYGISLMERLMNRSMYQKASTTNKYDPRVITKLIRNFRSHRKIIEFSSRVFYGDDLIAKASAASTNWAVGWEHLPNKRFPVVFIACYGLSIHDVESNQSFYNLKEIETVGKCVESLLASPVNGREVLQSEIGVISPYKRQCAEISKIFREKGWSAIEVGPVEAYQGREKPVIVISTVRSNTDSVGFFNNPKRLNVSITRAQSLLIVIGNPVTLFRDPYWFDLLEWVNNNGGCEPPLTMGMRPTLSASNSLENLLRSLEAKEVENWKLTIDDFC